VLQRDYIMRMIEQAAEAVARAFGFIAQQKLDDAEDELDGAYAALGIDRELLGVLDAGTLARQLGDDDRIAAAVRVLLCDARLQTTRGDRGATRSKLRAARNLNAQLSAPAAALDGELESATRELERDRP
jgi:hypothetical protein